MFEAIWEALRPLIIQILKSPEFYVFIAGAITTILAILKVPGWVKDAVLYLLKKILESVKKTEQKSKTVKMSSEEKMADALKRLNEDSTLTKKEKKLIEMLGPKRIIEEAVLPNLQEYFKEKTVR